ncbi:MAG: hypothetical protein KGI59_02810 [Patescibacteria group bacterium]|nr:hypothetical protein [Patescibacteria group bacterium]MDE2172617.1 hypothetical protein [Patescibacteria group bacterium]
MYKESFWSLAALKQPVNQWLVIAFLGVFCFWATLYYVTQKAEIIAESYTVPIVKAGLSVPAGHQGR